MKQIYLLSIIAIASLINAAIRTDEITLRLGEVIDFDSGIKQMSEIDTQSGSTCRTREDVYWRKNAPLLHHSGQFENDIGFFFNGFFVDCFGAPPQENCTEGLKSIFASSDIYEFKKSTFYTELDNQIDTADAVTFLKTTKPVYTNYSETSGLNVACTLSEGPMVTITSRNSFFFLYYYFVTDKGHECIFTILKRDTVDKQCDIDRFNAIRIRYYLKTKEDDDFSSISTEIRERMATNVKKQSVLPLSRKSVANTSTPLTCDMLGRMPGMHGNAAGVKILGSNAQKPSGAVMVK